jgi:hypothetical protein
VEINVGHFMHDAANTAGSVVKTVGKIAYGIGESAFDWATWPIQTAIHIAGGQRIDQAVLGGLHKALHAAKVLGPYVEAVVSFVPGLGTPVAAAIGGGLALVDGKPIDEIMLSAAAGAIPGGVFVKDAYDIGKAAVQRKPMLQVLEEGVFDLATNLGVVIPDETRDALVHGLGLAQDTINGIALGANDVKKAMDMVPDPAKKALIAEAAHPGSKINVADVVLESAISQIPNVDAKAKKDISNALAIGMAMGHGKNLQEEAKHAVTSPDAVQKLSHQAATLADKDPLVASARANLAGQGVVGFDQGIALINTPGVTQAQLLAARNALGTPSSPLVAGEDDSLVDEQRRRHHHHHHHKHPRYTRLAHHRHERHHVSRWTKDQLGFDTALALHLGRAKAPGFPPANFTFRQRAARAIAIGAHHAPPDVREHVLHTVNDKESLVGVRHGRHEIGGHPFAWSVGAGLLGLAVLGPVGAAVGAGAGYFFSR